MENDYILEIDNVTKTFPGVTALSNVSFKVKRGEIHGLCGENGAGKSTLMKILSGVHSHDTYEGVIKLNSEEIKFVKGSIRQAIEKGIAIVYQELALVPFMTVGENIFLGKEPCKNGFVNWDRLYSETDQILANYNLNIPSTAKVDDLGVGKKQMVEIAKALSEEAQVLILDEPTSALTDVEIETLMKILKILKEKGVTCIYISHKLEEFFKIADTITIFRDGKLITTQSIKDLTTEMIVAHMVGREMKERFPKSTRKPGEIVMSVKNLTVEDPEHPGKKIIKNVSFDLKAGEILGVAGLMGSGRTELVTSIFGEYGEVTGGKVIIQGNEVIIKNAREAMKYNISLVPEDRKKQGLILMQTILQNIALPNMNQFSSFMRINTNKELNECEKYAKSLSIKCPHLHVKTNTLSGGNQQKVVIAKSLMSLPKVLILDEPTRGIDVGAKFEIYKLMNQLAEQGVAIIMISSELEEVIGMSDRIIVMCEGSSSIAMDKKDVTQEIIMTCATGISSD